eukprot:272172_1
MLGEQRANGNKLRTSAYSAFRLLNERIQGADILRHRHPSYFTHRCASNGFLVQRLSSSDALYGHDGCVNTVNWSDCGRYLVSGSDDSTVKVWDYFRERQRRPESSDRTLPCTATLRGHNSNVFDTHFMPFSSETVVSGGNDADCRLFDVTTETCTTVYRHFTRKVLSVALTPQLPRAFLAGSSDGSVRMFDTRAHYPAPQNTRASGGAARVLPQAFGGGPTYDRSRCRRSLLIDFKKHRGSTSNAALSVCFHPLFGNLFICSAQDGFVRLFDLRKIRDFNPNSCVKRYRNEQLRFRENHDPTFCGFNEDGSEILVSCLNDGMYIFDTNHSGGDSTGLPRDLSDEKSIWASHSSRTCTCGACASGDTSIQPHTVSTSMPMSSGSGNTGSNPSDMGHSLHFLAQLDSRFREMRRSAREALSVDGLDLSLTILRERMGFNFSSDSDSHESDSSGSSSESPAENPNGNYDSSIENTQVNDEYSTGNTNVNASSSTRNQHGDSAASTENPHCSSAASTENPLGNSVSSTENPHDNGKSSGNQSANHESLSGNPHGPSSSGRMCDTDEKSGPVDMTTSSATSDRDVSTHCVTEFEGGNGNSGSTLESSSENISSNRSEPNGVTNSDSPVDSRKVTQNSAVTDCNTSDLTEIATGLSTSSRDVGGSSGRLTMSQPASSE